MKIEISAQQMADLKGSGHVVVGHEIATPGKVYDLAFGGEVIKAKCTQTFGPPMKAHFVTVK